MLERKYPLPDPFEMAELADQYVRRIGMYKLRSKITGLLPLDAQHPLTFSVGDFLRGKGFALADGSGRGIYAFEGTAVFGLLLPPKRWVGALYFGEGDGDWYLRIFGIKNVTTLLQLAEEMGAEFNTTVIPNFSSEREKKEKS